MHSKAVGQILDRSLLTSKSRKMSYFIRRRVTLFQSLFPAIIAPCRTEGSKTCFRHELKVRLSMTSGSNPVLFRRCGFFGKRDSFGGGKELRSVFIANR